MRLTLGVQLVNRPFKWLCGLAALVALAVVVQLPTFFTGWSPMTTATPLQYSTAAWLERFDPVPETEFRAPGQGDGTVRIDVRGQEVVRALARYSIDRRGNLYEHHSPETEIPRLRPPVM
jgi:hypothetical protein